jgi:hypothetical protein
MWCEAANETAIDLGTASGRLINGLFFQDPNIDLRLAGFDRDV